MLGTYEVACAEYCGTGHYAMRGTVVVDTQEDFNKWLAEQPTFAETMNEGPMVSKSFKHWAVWLVIVSMAQMV